MSVIAWLNSDDGLAWTREHFHPVWHTPLVSVKDDNSPSGSDFESLLFYTSYQAHVACAFMSGHALDVELPPLDVAICVNA